jgi:hypothetical protein
MTLHVHAIKELKAGSPVANLSCKTRFVYGIQAIYAMVNG